MIKVRYIEKLRDKHNKIYGYTLQDEQGNQMNVQADALKNAIRAGQVDCINLNLTDDNRLVNNSFNGGFRSVVNITEEKHNKVGTIRIKGINTPPSIYGISVKNVKQLTGREGAYYYATVYKTGTKLGEWSQSPYGAIVDDFYFDEHELDDAVQLYAKYKGVNSVSKESFMNDLVILADYYKKYSKIVKEGKKYLVVITDEYDFNVLSFSAIRIYLGNQLHPSVQKTINECKVKIIEQGLEPVVKIFDSVDNFIIQ